MSRIYWCRVKIALPPPFRFPLNCPNSHSNAFLDVGPMETKSKPRRCVGCLEEGFM